MTAIDDWPDSGRLVNTRTGRVLAEDARVARSLAGQMLGFIARRDGVWPGGALGIPRCPRVHTFGCARPLDVVHCDRAGRALFIVAALAPNRLGPGIPGAYWAWEAEAGALAPLVAPGDTLALMPPAAAGPPPEKRAG